jgi:hypothetical protein
VLVSELAAILHDLAEADSELVFMAAVRQALGFDDRYGAPVAKHEVNARSNTVAHARNDPMSREH